MIPTDRRADLHCHSTYSDGSCSPSELIDMACLNNHFALSITDHDTTDAYEDAKAYADERGILLIPGVELSTIFQGEAIHVLGYSFNSKDESLKEFCRIHRTRRDVRNQLMLEKLAERGMVVSLEEIIEISPHAHTYGRPHIALAMVRRGYVPNVQVAFQKFLGGGRCCYVEGEKWTTEQAIVAVRKAGGLAVLAHPHLIRSKSLIRAIVALPFDGIEVYYAHMGMNENVRWLEIAKQRGLLVTGGSDFHGQINPESHFGSSWSPESSVERLREVLLQHAAS